MNLNVKHSSFLVFMNLLGTKNLNILSGKHQISKGFQQKLKKQSKFHTFYIFCKGVWVGKGVGWPKRKGVPRVQAALLRQGVEPLKVEGSLLAPTPHAHVCI